MEITKELIDKAKACKNAEGILALAKENGYELSLEEAELFLQDFAEGELADEELDGVAGGTEGCKPANPYEDVYWDRAEDVQFLFKEGDIVQAFTCFGNHHTAKCKVVNKEAHEIYEHHSSSEPRTFLGWADVYWLEKEPGVRAPFIKGWNQRHNIEK